jgi:hypothetical protein
MSGGNPRSTQATLTSAPAPRLALWICPLCGPPLPSRWATPSPSAAPQVSPGFSGSTDPIRVDAEVERDSLSDLLPWQGPPGRSPNRASVKPVFPPHRDLPDQTVQGGLSHACVQLVCSWLSSECWESYLRGVDVAVRAHPRGSPTVPAHCHQLWGP